MNFICAAARNRTTPRIQPPRGWESDLLRHSSSQNVPTLDLSSRSPPNDVLPPQPSFRPQLHLPILHTLPSEPLRPYLHHLHPLLPSLQSPKRTLRLPQPPISTRRGPVTRLELRRLPNLSSMPPQRRGRRSRHHVVMLHRSEAVEMLGLWDCKQCGGLV